MSTSNRTSSKPSKPNPLFSLAARMKRRSERPSATKKKGQFFSMAIGFDGLPHPGDDNCPHCIAEREGKPFGFTPPKEDPLMKTMAAELGYTEVPDEMLPATDGSPPPAFTKEFLIAEVRTLFKMEKPIGSQRLDLINFFSFDRDGALERQFFSVDRQGRIYWTSCSGKDTLITEVPRAS